MAVRRIRTATAFLMTAAILGSGQPLRAEEWTERLRDLEGGATPSLDIASYQIAQVPDLKDFDIPAQPLANAVALFGQQAGEQISVDADLIRNARSAGV